MESVHLRTRHDAIFGAFHRLRITESLAEAVLDLDREFVTKFRTDAWKINNRITEMPGRTYLFETVKWGRLGVLKRGDGFSYFSYFS